MKVGLYHQDGMASIRELGVPQAEWLELGAARLGFQSLPLRKPLGGTRGEISVAPLRAHGSHGAGAEGRVCPAFAFVASTDDTSQSH